MFSLAQFFTFFVGLPNTVSPTIVHGGERYSAHEQDLPPARQVSNAHEQDLFTNQNV